MDATPIEFNKVEALKELKSYRTWLTYQWRIKVMEESMYREKVAVVDLMIAHFNGKSCFLDCPFITKERQQKGGNQ